jgi:hypothetical protein
LAAESEQRSRDTSAKSALERAADCAKAKAERSWRQLRKADEGGASSVAGAVAQQALRDLPKDSALAATNRALNDLIGPGGTHPEIDSATHLSGKVLRQLPINPISKSLTDTATAANGLIISRGLTALESQIGGVEVGPTRRDLSAFKSGLGTAVISLGQGATREELTGEARLAEAAKAVAASASQVRDITARSERKIQSRLKAQREMIASIQANKEARAADARSRADQSRDKPTGRRAGKYCGSRPAPGKLGNAECYYD